jgi:DNA/RNA endonuclease YhcR with UshA esterase domain
MAKRPEDRFDSAGQFAKALRVHTIPVAERAGSGSGLATFAQQSGVLAPLERQEAASAAVSRRTAMVAAGAGVGVVVLVGTFLFLMPRSGTGTGTGTGTGGAGSNSTSGGNAAVADARGGGGGGADRARIDEAVQRATAPQPPTAATTSVPAETSASPTAGVAGASLAKASSPAASGAAQTPAPAPLVTPPSDLVPSVLDVTETAALTKIASGGDPRYPRKEATVQGVVRSAAVSSTGKVCRVEFVGNEGGDGFMAVYFPGQFKAMEQKFGGTDGAALAGKRVRIKGRVEMYQDRPQIRIDSPDQVEVVK